MLFLFFLLKIPKVQYGWCISDNSGVFIAINNGHGIWTDVKLEKRKKLLRNIKVHVSQLTFTCSKSTIKTLEKGVKYVQSQ